MAYAFPRPGFRRSIPPPPAEQVCPPCPANVARKPNTPMARKIKNKVTAVIRTDIPHLCSRLKKPRLGPPVTLLGMSAARLWTQNLKSKLSVQYKLPLHIWLPLDRVDEVVLAFSLADPSCRRRDFEAPDRLHAKASIGDGKSKAKSVVLTGDALANYSNASWYQKMGAELK